VSAELSLWWKEAEKAATDAGFLPLSAQQHQSLKNAYDSVAADREVAWAEVARLTAERDDANKTAESFAKASWLVSKAEIARLRAALEAALGGSE
jgi:hypothetical protein